MRITVLIIAILGSAASGFLSSKWYSDWIKLSDKVQFAKALLDEVEAGGKGNPAKIQEARESYAKFRRLGNTIPFLMGSAVLGLVGGVVAMQRFKLVAALTLLVACAGPVLVCEEPPILIFTGLLGLAGLLSLLISSTPKTRSRKAKEQARKPAPRSKKSARVHEEDFEDDEDLDDFEDDEDFDDFEEVKDRS